MALGVAGGEFEDDEVVWEETVRIKPGPISSSPSKSASDLEERDDVSVLW